MSYQRLGTLEDLQKLVGGAIPTKPVASGQSAEALQAAKQATQVASQNATQLAMQKWHAEHSWPYCAKCLVFGDDTDTTGRYTSGDMGVLLLPLAAILSTLAGAGIGVGFGLAQGTMMRSTVKGILIGGALVPSAWMAWHAPAMLRCLAIHQQLKASQ